MIQNRLNPLAKAVVTGAALLAMAGAQAAGSTVQITGPTGPLAVGDLFTLTLSGQDFVEVNGGGLNLSFTAGLLELRLVEVDSIWTFWSQPGTIDNASGTLSDLVFNVFAWKSDDFPIATLQFEAKASGTGFVNVSGNEDWPFATPAGVTPHVDYGSYNVAIAGPIPEPAAWLMMLGGLGLLGFRARQSATGGLQST